MATARALKLARRDGRRSIPEAFNSMTRDTSQRRAIRSALQNAGRPLSPLEILRAARKRSPGMGLATVYRALKALVEERWADAVEIPGDAPRYEVRHRGHHHHFVCRQCDRVYEVEGCLKTLVRSLTPAGFRLDDHDMTLYGRCAECSRESG